jgi:hypothetical protein
MQFEIILGSRKLVHHENSSTCHNSYSLHFTHNLGCAKMEFSKQSLLPCSILADFLPRPKKKFAEVIMTESKNVRPNLYEKAYRGKHVVFSQCTQAIFMNSMAQYLPILQ